MGTRNAETNQGESGVSSSSSTSAPAPTVDHIRSRAGNQIFKSGPLFISSKGIGWTSWKKRWFILTRTSLVFFRSDPSVIPQKGSEVNLTLGGIDLNNSGSVVVKEDKKLLTVLFPDGRDGRAFTLKAETLEDLYEWKTALENALAQAPSAALVMGQNGIFRNEPTETAEGGSEQSTDRQPVKSLVIGRPILLALEDIDGTPSFLEKALTFIEQHGVKVEGVLRQSAAVDDVNRRVREYEEGKNEFSPDEDAHLIADCAKHVLRALPSSPVPASCCNALLEACRADRGGRINAMRAAIAETFPEPNLRLLQRILKMMQIVVSHKSENRMSCSAVSACMAPLLLRPLLAGECELEHDFNMGGDGSAQLLQAAAAANHAQAIVITLMEEYDNIFGEYNSQEGSVYSDTEESGSEGDEVTDDDDILEDDEDTDSQHNADADTEDEVDEEGASNGSISENSCTNDDQSDNKVCVDSNSKLGTVEVDDDVEANRSPSGRSEASSSKNENVHSDGNLQNLCITSLDVHTSESCENVEVAPASRSLSHEETDQNPYPLTKRSTSKSNEFTSVVKRPTVWGRTSARKNLSMESIDFNEDEIEIQKLELTKNDLQSKITVEVRENADLHACLENKKKELHERRLALEQDVFGLQEQLRKERELREIMEARLNKPLGRSTIPPTIDDKTKAELEDISQAEEDIANLKKKVSDLHSQLNQHSNTNDGVVCGACGQPQQKATHLELQDRREDLDGAVTTSHLDKSRKGEDGMSRADSGNARTEETSYLQKKHYSEKKQIDFTTDSAKSRANSGNVRTEETAYSQKKPSSEKKQMDLTTDSAKSLGTAGPSSSVDSVSLASSTSSGSKKSVTKAEGTASTSSALSKLTTRLNFLKERRSQIVNELQSIENNRGSSESSMIVAPPKMNPR